MAMGNPLSIESSNCKTIYEWICSGAMFDDRMENDGNMSFSGMVRHDGMMIGESSSNGRKRFSYFHLGGLVLFSHTHISIYPPIHPSIHRTIDLFIYPILSFPILSYPSLSFPILSQPFLSFPILSYPFLLLLAS